MAAAPKFNPATAREIGSSVSYQGGVADQWEDNPELRGLKAVATYDRMRKTDAECASILRSIGLPIRRTKWSVMGSGVDDRVIKFVEANLGLQADEQGRRRKASTGISFDEFIRHALISLPIGFMPFEQVYAPGTPDEALGLDTPIVANLAKLAPRMPRTITELTVDNQGSFQGLKQYVNVNSGPFTGVRFPEEITIPVDRLVMFCNDREGSNWMGESILRSCWKHWFMKDQLLRMSAMIVERNGMGVPKVSYPPDRGKAEAMRVVSDIRMGERAGVAVPNDFDVELMGVTGSTVDPLPLINYHDQAIGRSALAMFLNLGHDRGARALGDTFVDFFTNALNATTAYFEEVITEHVIRDLVALNFGESEPYPAIVADEITPDVALQATDLAVLAQYGVITTDPGLEDDTRRRHGLPPVDPTWTKQKPDPNAIGPLPKLPDATAVTPENAPTADQARVNFNVPLGEGTDLDLLSQRYSDLLTRIDARKAQEAARATNSLG